jgi:hypothetical protein
VEEPRTASRATGIAKRLGAVALVAVALIAALGVAGISVGHPHESAKPTAPDCTPVLAKKAHGKDAVVQLGANLTQVAGKHGKQPKGLKQQLISDESLWVDTCGELFFQEEDEIPVDPPQLAPTLVFPAEQTFLLHSKVGAGKVIYIDFNGELISGTAWNASFTSGQDIAAPAFDIDGAPGTFSNEERAIVQNVWLRVAEDYATFNVDVTTEDPGLAAIDRSGNTDASFGGRALVTNESQLFTACGCAGISYVGIFDSAGSHQYYQPSWAFQRGTGGNAKVIGEVVSHEIGHSLGLSHDGTSTASYYSGQGSWAPIMGTAYNRPISQWSNGSYTGANNTEDDVAIIQSHGLALRTDDVSDTRTSALALQTVSTFQGRIGSAGDVDWFSFTGSGQVSITGTVKPTSPNLDLEIDLYNAAGTLIASDDPAATTVSGDVAAGLSATLQYSLPGAGTYYFRLGGVGYGDPASNGYSDYASVGEYTLDLLVSDASTGPTITTASLPNAVFGQAYSVTLAGAGGVPSYVYGLTGSSGPLPGSLTLESNTGKISGVPVDGAGTYTMTFKIIDHQGNSSTKQLSLTVVDAPVTITSSVPLAPASLGVPYSLQLTAAGGRSNYLWSLASGTVPAGLTLSATGVLSGTPTRATSYSFTIRVTSGTTTVTKAFSMTITSALKVSTTALADGTVDVAYSVSLAATGGTTPYAWDINATQLPPGLSVSGVKIVGVPTQTGRWPIDMRVTDGSGRTASTTLSITVYKVSITADTTLPAAMRGFAYSTTLTADGGVVPYKWTLASGTLPTGLSLASTTGVISGTTQFPGTYSFVVQATDAASRVARKPSTLVVEQDPARPYVTNTSLPAGSLTKAYSAQLSAVSGRDKYVWSLASGTLPAGLTLSPDGALNGTPTAATSYSFTVRVTSGTATDTKAFVVPVTAPVVVSTTSLLNGTVGTAYSISLAATGGTRTYSWAIDSGALPAGLSLIGSKISGTPTTRGTSTVVLRVTDTAGRIALSTTLALNVYQVTISTGASLPAATRSQAYSVQLVADGGVAPYVWARSSGALPSGLTLSTAGLISGTPTVTGNFTYTVKVADAQSRLVTKTFTLVVAL